MKNLHEIRKIFMRFGAQELRCENFHFNLWAFWLRLLWINVRFGPTAGMDRAFGNGMTHDDWSIIGGSRQCLRIWIYFL